MLTFYPYSLKLKELLTSHYGDKEPVEVYWDWTIIVCKVLSFSVSHSQVDTMGVSGERVITAMSERLDETLKVATKSYDWILLLGGRTSPDRNLAIVTCNMIHVQEPCVLICMWCTDQLLVSWASRMKNYHYRGVGRNSRVKRLF